MMRRTLDFFFRKNLHKHTTRYLDDLASVPSRTSQQQMTKLLGATAATNKPFVTLGTTSWGQPVVVPVSELLSSHGLITGGSGAGKTYFALLILQALIDQLPQNNSVGFAVLDPKGELFNGALCLLANRLDKLEAENPKAAAELRSRIVIVDFASADPISSYNILSRRPDIDPNFLAVSRADLLADLLPDHDNLSVNGSAVLRRTVQLLVENNLPITRLDDVLHDEDFRSDLLRQSGNPALKLYFTRQYPAVPKSTVNAISRRVETLFSSQSVFLALAGLSAPDLRAIQDDSKILLVNCFGRNLNGGVRQLLQSLVLSDIHQAVFARQRTDHPFLFFLDECQTMFANSRLRDHMGDLVTMARSFGSFFIFLTQNISTAVNDNRLLANIFTNAKWTFSMRGQPSDCGFLKAAIPATGRRLRPQTDPFDDPGFYSFNEERTIEHEAIASLPDRTGYFWPRAHSAEAVKMVTQTLTLPSGDARARAAASLRSDPTIGGRISRREYDEKIARRDEPPLKSQANLDEILTSAYKRKRGGNQ